MRKFVEIHGNIVWSNPFDVSDDFIPVYPAGIAIAVDVTNLNPQPAQGWIYDPETGIFSAPPPEPDPVPPETPPTP